MFGAARGHVRHRDAAEIHRKLAPANDAVTRGVELIAEPLIAMGDYEKTDVDRQEENGRRARRPVNRR